MSSCVPGPRSLRASGPRWAGPLLALGAIILVLSSIPPAAAAEALNPARLAALTAAKAPTAPKTPADHSARRPPAWIGGSSGRPRNPIEPLSA